MLRHLKTATLIYLLLTVLTGVVYPLAVTAIAQIAMPARANGSLLERGGRTVGSALVGQGFSGPGYFWGRPSATGPLPYNAAASSGSNLGPTNPALEEAVRGRVAAFHAANPASDGPVPVDLVTSSGSGLDPHISPAAAEAQVPRVAARRGLAPARLRAMVAEHTEGRTLGLLGERRVNVLALNLALDAAADGAP